MGDSVLLERKEKLAVLKLNQPDSLNAMGEEMAQDFSSVVEELRKDPARVVIITGNGRAFSAGGDLEMLTKKQSLSHGENERLMLQYYNSFLKIRSLGVPLIAAINGHAIGAGLVVACSCDVRIGVRGSKLGFTFTKLGLHPGMGATYFVPKVIGSARAAEILLTARVVSADQAHHIGLLSEVCEKAEGVLPRAEEIAGEILGCGKLATAQLIKSLRGEEAELEAALSREAGFQAENYASDEFAEGISAIKEKRSPNF